MAQEQELRLKFQQKLIEILELGKKKKNMLEDIIIHVIIIADFKHVYSVLLEIIYYHLKLLRIQI